MRTSKHYAAPLSAPPRAQHGVTVLELMVAVVIGAVLIFGATQVYVDSRNNYTVNESVARLQETARYAMTVLEPDIQMSNYWGLVYGAEGVQGQASQISTATQSPLAPAATCGKNYAQDLQTNIEGANDSYTIACQALNNNPMPNADTITIRRATVAKSDTVGTPSGPLRVCSTRSAGVLITDSTVCGLAGAEFHDVIVDAYYVDKDSDQQTGLPSLRRKYLKLDPMTGVLDFADAEITPGIEDMQVQYGVDTSGGLGVTSGAAVQYLDAGATLNGLLNNAVSPAQIVSVRVWLLVRAEQPEVGFTDQRTYTYGDRTDAALTNDLTVVTDNTKSYNPSNGTDTGPNDPRHFRRVLIMKTIQLRNSLGS